MKTKKGRHAVTHPEKENVIPLHKATGWLLHRLGRAQVFPERGRPGWLRIAIDVRPYGYEGQERVLEYDIQLVLANDRCVTLRDVECVHSGGFPLEIVARPAEQVAADPASGKLPVSGVRVRYNGKTTDLPITPSDGP